jgi:hypothetical protein
MLNIAESVPSTEPVQSNFRNSVPMKSHWFPGVPLNSGTRFNFCNFNWSRIQPIPGIQYRNCMQTLCTNIRPQHGACGWGWGPISVRNWVKAESDRIPESNAISWIAEWNGIGTDSGGGIGCILRILFTRSGPMIHLAYSDCPISLIIIYQWRRFAMVIPLVFYTLPECLS